MTALMERLANLSRPQLSPKVQRVLLGVAMLIFVVGGYFAIALLGAALLDRTLVPAWTAWILVVFGGVAGLSHWAARPNLMGMRSPFDLPVLVQLAPLFVAIPLAAGQL